MSEAVARLLVHNGYCRDVLGMNLGLEWNIVHPDGKVSVVALHVRMVAKRG
jgi:hypothetical protein